MSKYNGIVGPNKEELDEIEMMFNPDKLKNEDLFAEISEDTFYEDEFLDMSRTERGYRRKTKVLQRNSNGKTDEIVCEKLSKEDVLDMAIEKLDFS